MNLGVEKNMLLLVDTEQSLALRMQQLFVKGNAFYRSPNEKVQENTTYLKRGK